MTQTDPQVVAFSSRRRTEEIVDVVGGSGPGIVESLWLYKWSSLAITLLAVALAAGAGLALAPGAQATAVVALATPPSGNVLAPNIQGDASLARYTAQRAGFVTSDAVLTVAAARLGQENPTALRSRVSTSPSTTSNAISITTTASTPAEAVALADAIIAAYTEETRKEVTRLTETAVASIELNAKSLEQGPLLSKNATVNAAAADSISELQLQAMEMRRDAQLFGGGVEYVNQPSLDAVKEPGVPTREIGVGLVLGLVIAGTVAWTRADRASRFPGGRMRRGRSGPLFTFEG